MSPSESEVTDESEKARLKSAVWKTDVIEQKLDALWWNHLADLALDRREV